ncbi:MAG: hypothetical protein ACJ72I_24180 [Pseudonocardiaceae bacterium]
MATTVPGDTDVLSVQCTRILASSLRATHAIEVDGGARHVADFVS